MLAISVDSVFVHKAWQEVELSKLVEGGLPYPMLSDAGGDIGRIYGVYDEEVKVDVRGTFIIDPDGVVQAFEILIPPVGRNPEEFIRWIKALQHVRKTGGAEVTPSGWEPGCPVLKPGVNLVGKVWEEWKQN
ncbi:peroxiredoxin (alkyl hydroperoxide reductase subunit C) [Thermosediminibacter litoriperuensis]|uniref:Peroxiredoxin (Alkyl hydroperoxide reductase subunit C) n=1 Tax=Thermosediminibacter litoriperuensis TaxID=291989 RepID=A0A5S5ACC3_9FIRM|nr:peroxiredoxin (alkyl hydroperoxide reductase subunit C) [Thermosediminibacter litoriperuensis]